MSNLRRGLGFVLMVIIMTGLGIHGDAITFGSRDFPSDARFIGKLVRGIIVGNVSTGGKHLPVTFVRAQPVEGARPRLRHAPPPPSPPAGK